MRLILSSVLFLGASTSLGGCHAPDRAPDSADADQVHALYLELERKYCRTWEKDGYSIDYAVQPPRTIVITLRYQPGTPRAAVGHDVLNAARTFVDSIAREKYGIQVQIETRALVME
jgi:hypothetical protein